MTERAAGTYVFNTDRLPHNEVTLAVRRDPNRQVPRDQESGGGPEVGYVRQYPPEDLGLRGMPRLEGRTRYCNGDALGGCVEVVFRENGHEYVLRHEYGIGFDAEPEGMNVFRDMVHGLQIEGRATVTPTPVLNSEIGPGPLWSQDQAVDRALEMIPFGPWDVTDTRLVTEQEAWRLNRCDMGRDDPEPLWYTYPSAVWIVEMTGLFEEKHTVYYTYLDAESGWHICTAEQGRPRQVSGESTPEPEAAP